jgi:hypothetical protein
MVQPVVSNTRSRRLHPELECGLGEWDQLVYGNHRMVLEVLAAPKGILATRAEVPWRRQDSRPADVDIIVVSAVSGRRVRNVLVESAGAESGRIVFEAVDGPGCYYLYYQPYAQLGHSHYPQASYLPYRQTAAPQWADAVTSSAWQAAPAIPPARVVRYEAASERDSYAPMNFTATALEMERLHDAHAGRSFLLFPEDRLNLISMRDAVPAHWAIEGPAAEFRDEALPGEDYVVQLGLYALTDLDSVRVEIESAAGGSATTTGSTSGQPMTGHCLNTSGTNRLRRPFSRTLSVPKGRVQALYVVLPVPEGAAGTTLSASITVSAGTPDTDTASVRVELAVASLADADPDILAGGFGEPKYLRRLPWLDSTLAQDHELVPPFTPVCVDEASRTLRILGRELVLAPSGLPAQVISTFTSSVTGTDGPRRELLAGHIQLAAEQPWDFSALDFRVDGPAQISWRSRWSTRELSLELTGVLEADGACSYSLGLAARDDVILPEIALDLRLHADAVPLAMGLGVPGGRRPLQLAWSWDVANCNQDALWLGDMNIGMQLSLRHGSYERPLNTNFYRDKPLVEPDSWANRQDGKVQGGIRLDTSDGVVTVCANSGARRLTAGQRLDFDFRLLLTPFKPIDPQRHLANRYFHAPADPQTIQDAGATVVNIHHATAVAPYINDPLLSADRLAEYTTAAHAHGLKVKVYNTVRELTFHSPELLPMMSLDHEVFSDGPGKGHIWLQEHVASGYVSAWFARNVDDIAVVTRGGSRLENSYVRGLDELVRQTGLDGIYLDDIAYDREAMKRVRKVLSRRCPDPQIDLHSANQFNAKDGFVSSANLYMEHLPYTDRLWLGEYFDYNGSVLEYWLVEISGIPFGLMGEMLEGGGNPWRGMVFGMTGRAPKVDNRPLWDFWARSGLERAQVIGFWADNAPVRTGHPLIPATSWLTEDGTVVALASWADEAVDVTLDISADIRGSSGPLRITAPAIEGFQGARSYGPGETIHLEPGRGALLTIGADHV